MSQSQVETLHRIYTNLQVLLAEGLFPGKIAAAVVEATSLINKVVQDMTEPSADGEGKQAEAVQNDRSAKRSRRVERGGVRNSGRKGSEGKGE